MCDYSPGIITSIVVVRRTSAHSDKIADFNVCSIRLRRALLWLKTNNRFYRDIVINEQALSALPENGNVYGELQYMEIQGVDDEKDDVILEHTSVPQVVPINQQERIASALQPGTVAWPTVFNVPINEFTTEGYIVQAFPTLFPTGDGDLRDTSRQTQLKPTQYFQYLMQYHDGRFACDSRFRFFALNSVLRWNAISQGNILVKKVDLNGKTAGQLKEILQTDPNLANKVMFFASSLRITKSYWFKRCGELKDTVEFIGVPTVFFTLSAADVHWPELYDILAPGEHLEDMPQQLASNRRRQLLCENPLIVSWFFQERASFYIKKVLGPVFNVKDSWFRYEWQHRGSSHVHGLLWLEGAPHVETIDLTNLDQVTAVTAYFHNLVSTVNLGINDPPSIVHPCQVRPSEIQDSDKDLTELLNKVQRHTRCSEGYCLRRKKNSTILHCRFKFPFVMCEETNLTKDVKGELVLQTERNDPLLNRYNKFIIQSWRANIDIQPVMSKHAVLNYIAKYAAKSEPQSKSFNDLLKNILTTTVKAHDPAKLAIQKLIIQSLAERDISAQECCHLLMGYPLYQSSRSFVSISVGGDQWVPLAVENEPQDNTNKKLTDMYPTRPDAMNNLSLLDLASKHYWKGRWVCRKTPAVVRVFPKLFLGPDEDKNDAYYHQQVLLKVPWTSEDELNPTNQSWKIVFHNAGLVAQGEVATEIESDDEEEWNEEEPVREQEEWMVIAGMGPNDQAVQSEIGLREFDTSFPWTESFANYPSIETVSNFLPEIKRIAMLVDNNIPTFVNYSSEQQQVLDILSDQITSVKCKTVYNSVHRLIVQGTAGTGKSTVIKAMTTILREELGDDSFLLLAPTGVAAFNINASTIHSALHIGTNSSKFTDLAGKTEREYQIKMKSVKFLLIDEYSMIGCSLLAMIDKRTRQAKPDEAIYPFGNMFVYLFGDIRQLPPVCDRPLYTDKPCTYGLTNDGLLAYRSFSHCHTLSVVQRQAGDSPDQVRFRELLSRLSRGCPTQDDWILLSTRFQTSLSVEEQQKFSHSLYLAQTKEIVIGHNIQHLTDLGLPVAKISALHNCTKASRGTDDVAQGLQSTIYLSRGSRVMLRSNLWTSHGLVNGATGIVEDIIYAPHTKPPNDQPLCVLVIFDNYTGPSFHKPKMIPICPVARAWTESGTNCTRTQFPLQLAWAVTIHKCQGMTLDSAVISLGSKEFAIGMSFVGISRVRSLNDLMINPAFPFDRIGKLHMMKNLQLRSFEEARHSSMLLPVQPTLL